MALISCSECGGRVSNRAEQCIHCGAPITTLSDLRSTGSYLTTVQETSKRLKLHILLAVALIIVGLFIEIAAINSSSPDDTVIGAFMMMAGFFWFIVTRIRIWWHHK